VARVLIDSSVLIDHIRGVPIAGAWLIDAITVRVELASVTPVRTEVLAGMRPAEEPRTRELLQLMSWIDITPEIADRAGDLLRQHRQPGVRPEIVDYLLAAAAQLEGASVATLNVRDFPMFPDLQPPY
jgi:hypothetical protein